MRSSLLSSHLPAHLAALLALVQLASCMNVAPPGPAIDSEPPGARVYVDGKDSGWVTPCLIALTQEEPHVVSIRLEGYAPREVRFDPMDRNGIIAWKQGVNGVKSVIFFPIFLPPVDFFIPLRESQALIPGRVFVRLRATDEP